MTTEMNIRNTRFKRTKIWKRILAGMGIILTLADTAGAGGQIQASDAASEYVEYTELDADEAEANETETDFTVWESKEADELFSDMEEESEEEQILDNQEEDTVETEPQSEQTDFQVDEQEEEFYEESAEAGNATDGSVRISRSIGRLRMAVRFQDCYGDQLDEGAKEIYDAMATAWGNGGTDSFSVEFQDPLIFQPTGEIVDGNWKWVAADATSTEARMKLDPAFAEAVDTLRRNIQGGFDACIYDNPEIFWLKNVSYNYSLVWVKYKDGTVIGKIKSVTVTGNESWSNAKNCVSEFQDMVNNAVETIQKSFTDEMTDAQKMKRIHDYICQKCVYLEGTYAHSAYGTFYNGKVVCEGYAKAYKILCNRMGLTCVLGSGTVHKTSSDGAHMWNYVRLDGGWYMVDVTWDDGSTLSDRYLFAGAQTEGYYYLIEQERTNYTVFSEGTYGCQFVQPALQENTYHEVQNWIITQPTCEKQGSRQGYCAVCEKTVNYYTEALGHSYGEWKVTREPGCTTEGEETRTCTVCGESETRKVEALSHSYGEWKVTREPGCITEGEETRTCTVCGESETRKVEALGHSYGEWTVTKKATALQKGQERRVCMHSGCEIYEGRDTDKLTPYVRLNYTSLTLQTQQTFNGECVREMQTGDAVITWMSSNTKVATVSKTGKIKAKKVGTATIYVILKSGITASCKIKVQKKEVSAKSITVTASGLFKNRLTIKKGKSLKLKTSVAPVTCRQKITYSSSNKKVVTVTTSGKIKARKSGKAKIKIRVGTVKKTITIIVKKW